MKTLTAAAAVCSKAVIRIYCMLLLPLPVSFFNVGPGFAIEIIVTGGHQQNSREIA